MANSDLKKIMKKAHSVSEERKRVKENYENKVWWTVRSVLGNYWANWYILIGARQRGKTFTVQEYILRCFFNPDHPLYHTPFYWLRLNDISLKAMLMNNGAKMFEPLLVARFPELMKMKVKGDSIFLEDGTLLCRCYGLSTAYNQKGSALFNQDTFRGLNIIVDEVALEKGQKKTFDFCYNLKMNVENICRNQRENVKIFMMLNNTDECPEALSMFGYIPVEFGVYKLRSKKCLIAYIPNTAGYVNMRKTALVNDIDNGTGNFTNKIERDIALIYKGRLHRPTSIIKFSKDIDDWYTIWDGNIICPYQKEKQPVIAMRRYIDELYSLDMVNNVIELNDARAFKFKDLYTQIRFNADLQLIKK